MFLIYVDLNTSQQEGTIAFFSMLTFFLEMVGLVFVLCLSKDVCRGIKHDRFCL